MSLFKISKIKKKASSLEETVDNLHEATENDGLENVTMTTTQQPVLVNQLMDLGLQVHSAVAKLLSPSKASIF
jgi:hypothetical protein